MITEGVVGGARERLRLDQSRCALVAAHELCHPPAMGDQQISRRSLLVAGAGLVGAGAVGRLSAATRFVPPASAAVGGPPTQAEFAELDAAMTGSVVLPSAPNFLTASQLFDPIYDTQRPLAVVQPANVADVSTAVKFAAAHTATFAPRAGGHSYVGASGGDQGIQLDVRRLNKVSYNSTNRTVVVGAGVRLYNVHTALEPFGRTLATGSCPTVGVSGLTLGGGIGFEDRLYGLTTDALRSIQVVLANGSTVVASATRNSDLFWACRGGGGGNFGIVTSFTFATSPALPVSFATLSWLDADVEAVLAGWQARIASASASSWPVLHLVCRSGSVQPSINVFSLGTPVATEVNALIAAIGRNPTAQSRVEYTHLQAYRQIGGCADFTDAECQPVVDGGKITRKVYLSGSDILGRALTAAEISAIASYLRIRAKTNSTTTLILEAFGGALANKAVSSTAFPWRTAKASVQWKVDFTSAPSASVKTSTYNWISTGHTKFGSASVGAYINYLEPSRALSSYYGSNYARLRQLRTKFDPEGLFQGKYVIPAA